MSKYRVILGCAVIFGVGALAFTRLPMQARVLGHVVEASHQCDYTVVEFETITQRYAAHPETAQGFERYFESALVRTRERIATLPPGTLPQFCKAAEEKARLAGISVVTKTAHNTTTD
ncbi:MAG: hypothetical protein AB8B71_18290 [Paracoccaceae bacterium]